MTRTRKKKRRDNRRIWVIDADAEPIFVALTKALGYVPKRKPR